MVDSNSVYTWYSVPDPSQIKQPAFLLYKPQCLKSVLFSHSHKKLQLQCAIEKLLKKVFLDSIKKILSKLCCNPQKIRLSSAYLSICLVHIGKAVKSKLWVNFHSVIHSSIANWWHIDLELRDTKSKFQCGKSYNCELDVCYI